MSKQKETRFKVGDRVWFHPGYFEPEMQPVLAKITKDWPIREYDYEVQILPGQHFVGPRKNLAFTTEIAAAPDLSTVNKVEAFLQS